MFSFPSCELIDYFPKNRVMQNCKFSGIGKISTRLHKRVVAVSTLEQLSEVYKLGDEISGVVCNLDICKEVSKEFGCVVSDSPIKDIYLAHDKQVNEGLFWPDFPTIVHESAIIDPSSHISKRNVIIGERSVVSQGASILERTILGEDTFIGSGCVIGTPAFEVAQLDGKLKLWKQAGGVKIGTGCALTGNVTVARSAFAVFTEIGDECFIDNLVHVAHDCILAKGVKIAAGSILAGRVSVGEGAFIGPNTTISNGLTVGVDSIVSIGSMVNRNVQPKSRVTGYFAVPHDQFITKFKSEK